MSRSRRNVNFAEEIQYQEIPNRRNEERERSRSPNNHRGTPPPYEPPARVPPVANRNQQQQWSPNESPRYSPEPVFGNYARELQERENLRENRAIEREIRNNYHNIPPAQQAQQPAHLQQAPVVAQPAPQPFAPIDLDIQSLEQLRQTIAHHDGISAALRNYARNMGYDV